LAAYIGRARRPASGPDFTRLRRGAGGRVLKPTRFELSYMPTSEEGIAEECGKRDRNAYRNRTKPTRARRVRRGQHTVTGSPSPSTSAERSEKDIKGRGSVERAKKQKEKGEQKRERRAMDESSHTKGVSVSPHRTGAKQKNSVKSGQERESTPTRPPQAMGDHRGRKRDARVGTGTRSLKSL